MPYQEIVASMNEGHRPRFTELKTLVRRIRAELYPQAIFGRKHTRHALLIAVAALGLGQVPDDESTTAFSPLVAEALI